MIIGFDGDQGNLPMYKNKKDVFAMAEEFLKIPIPIPK